MVKKSLLIGNLIGLALLFNTPGAKSETISPYSSQIGNIHFVEPAKGFLPIRTAMTHSSNIATLVMKIDRTNIYQDDYKTFHDDVLMLLSEWAGVSGIPGWSLDSNGTLPKVDESKNEKLYRERIFIISSYIDRIICSKDYKGEICKVNNDITEHGFTNQLYTYPNTSNSNNYSLSLNSYDNTIAKTYIFIGPSYPTDRGLPRKESIDDIYKYYSSTYNRGTYLFSNVNRDKYSILNENDAVNNIINKYKEPLSYNTAADENGFNPNIIGKDDTQENALRAFYRISFYSNNDIGSREFKERSQELFNKAPFSISAIYPFVGGTNLFLSKNGEDVERKNRVYDAFVNIGKGSQVDMIGNVLRVSVTDKTEDIVLIGDLSSIVNSNYTQKTIYTDIRDDYRNSKIIGYNGIPNICYEYDYTVYQDAYKKPFE